MWEVVDSGRSKVQEVMDRDDRLLRATAADGAPFFHFYDFEGLSATYGYFSDPLKLLNRQAVAERGLQLGKRVTGGGIIFHGEDLAFSIVLPRNHEGYFEDVLSCYSYVNNLVLEAIGRFIGQRKAFKLLVVEGENRSGACAQFCMARPTKYDIIFEGRKVAGAAIRRVKTALLYQGSIALGTPSWDFLEEVLMPQTGVLEAMKQNSYPLLGQDWTDSSLAEAKEQIRSLLRQSTQNL